MEGQGFTAPTKVCPHCGVQAQTTADRCPNCGKRYRRRFRGLRIAGWGCLGLVVGVIVIIVLIGVLISAGVEEAEDEQNETAITRQEFRSVELGMTLSQVRRRLGSPGDAQEFENEGLPGQAIREDCIYYNEQDEPLGEGQYFQFCFENRRLTSKNAY
jgi:hypothetical protein